MSCVRKAALRLHIEKNVTAGGGRAAESELESVGLDRFAWSRSRSSSR